MKAIIDGKRYDTEEAEAVASYHNGLGHGDFRFVDETLFLTKHGCWFIAGEGGAMTEYAEPVGDALTGGKAIRPLERQDAMVWLETHGNVAALERHFAEDIVDA